MSKLFMAKVLTKEPVGPGIFKIAVEEPELAQLAEPGQFVNIRVTEGLAPLLRRPISIHWVEQNKVELLFQVVGKGTKNLAKVSPGDFLDLQGPLGAGFRPTSGRTVLVGGGMGIAPLGFLAQRLEAGETSFLAGAANAALLKGAGFDRIKQLKLRVKAATDDGSYGQKGFVTKLLEEEIVGAKAVYACGPKPMLKEVARIALEHGVPCQVSLEEHMGCGVGACLGCVCKGAPAEGRDTFKRVCKDGPVFDVREVSWD